jgi:hypothetical protein
LVPSVSPMDASKLRWRNDASFSFNKMLNICGRTEVTVGFQPPTLKAPRRLGGKDMLLETKKKNTGGGGSARAKIKETSSKFAILLIILSLDLGNIFRP